MLFIDNIYYYAVDHTPSYFWESATRLISAALVVHIPSVIKGRDTWDQNATIQNAINIDKGVVVKENILLFQHLEVAYPHLLEEALSN